MRNKLLYFALILAVVLLVQNATAKEELPRPGRLGRVEKMIEIRKDLAGPELNLTDEQEKAFKKIDLTFQKETVAMRNDLQIKQLELQAELSEDKPDMKKIESLIDDIAKLRASIQKKRLAAHLQKRGLLDAEQQKIWDRQCPWGDPMERMRLKLGRGKGPALWQWFQKEDDDDEEEEE